MAVIGRSVSARTAVCQPTTLLENSSHTGQPQHSFTGHDPDQISDPQLVRLGRDEVPINQIRCDRMARILFGGTTFPALRRNTPCSLCSRMIRSTRLWPTRTP